MRCFGCFDCVFGVLFPLIVLSSNSEPIWAVLVVLTPFWHVPLLSLSVKCRFWPILTVLACSRDDSERNKPFWQHPLLSLTDKIARSATWDPPSMLEHAYMTIYADGMSHYDVLACSKCRFLTNFGPHLRKTVKFNFAAFLTCCAHDCPLSNEPFPMTLRAIGDPWGQLMC
jgi:hypothetical protein